MRLLALAYSDESLYKGRLGDTSGAEMVQQVKNAEKKTERIDDAYCIDFR